MNFLTTTKHYYAEWLNVAPAFLDVPGIHVIDSPKRDERQIGYSKQLDLYTFITERTIIISYGQRLRAEINAIERRFERADNLDSAKAALREHVVIAPQHTHKFCFAALPNDLDTSKARQLTRDDYPDFLHFHQQQYLNANAAGWLKSYFTAIADKGYVYGVYATSVSADQHLVSATDAPDIPYLQDLVVEPGINTLPEYRRRGYAKIVGGALLKHLLKTHKVPLWSCSSANVASRKLAESVGYVKFADVITLCLTE